MEKIRETISFTSFMEEAYWYTYIDLKLETIRITREKEVIFKGSIAEFKALEEIKAANSDKVYEDILRMSEELMTILTKA